jgi:GT2 family glycosyltransferase
MLPQVTITIVPCEQFSKTQVCLESVFAHTTVPFDLIYVDGKSPARQQRYLQQKAAEKSFRLIRMERYLPANAARNLAAPHIRTKFTVFMDNDVVVTPHWLERLLACADETGCWVVGPVYCAGDLAEPVIHTLGAEHGIDERDGVRRWREQHLFCGRKLNAVHNQLHRRPIDLVEFHCLMMRTELIQQFGGFDPDLLSYFDHNDFCLQVRDAGGAIYVEPSAVVHYLPPPPFAVSDVPYFLLRWSNRWIDDSVVHFARKHAIAADDPLFEDHYEYQRAQRARLLRYPRRTLRRLLGRRGMYAMETAIGRIIDWSVVAPSIALQSRP